MNKNEVFFTNNEYFRKNYELKDNKLYFEDNYIDLSHFDLQDFLDYNSALKNSYESLDPKAVWKIIYLHSLLINKNIELKNEQKSLETLSQNNEALKNVTIFENNNKQYISLYHNGETFVFENDIDIDLIEFIIDVQSHTNSNLTTDDLYHALSQKLVNIDLTDSNLIQNSNKYPEGFKKIISEYQRKTATQHYINVKGNHIENMVVLDSPVLEERKLFTYDYSKEGKLVITDHSNKLDYQKGQSANNDYNNENNQKNDNISFKNTSEKEDFSKFITLEEFYNLLESKYEWTDQQRKNVENYFGFFADLVLYQDYLTIELKQLLDDYIKYFEKLEMKENYTFTEHQEKARESLSNAFEHKKTTNYKNLDEEVKVRKLELLRKEVPINRINQSNEENNNSGFVSTFYLVLFLEIAAIALMFTTLMIIK